MTIKTFSFDDDANITRKTSKFKGKKGIVYRFGFGFMPNLLEKGTGFSLSDMTPEDPEDDEACEALAPLWVGHKTAYVEGVGYLLCDDPEIQQIISDKTDAKIKSRVGTVLISYPLDDKGNVNYPRMFQDPEKSIEIKPYIIDTGKYRKIKDKHVEGYYLWDNDLRASLEEDKPETFQSWEYALPKPKQCYNVLRRLLEKVENGEEKEVQQIKPLVDNILLRIKNVIENELVQVMGREISAQDLKEKLGFASGSSSDDDPEISTDEDVEAQLEGLSLSGLM